VGHQVRQACSGEVLLLTKAIQCGGAARIAGCPCRTVLIRAVAGVGRVSKRAPRQRRGDPRHLLLHRSLSDGSSEPF
jgi:hypothetical protein